GALEKPARPDALRQLLDSWQGPTLQVPAQTRLDVTELELHTANRRGQWLLHYQPQVDLRTGAFAGMEALVRWNHPSHGLVYPDQFIHIAEESGAINGLTEWVLGEAVRQAGRWRRDGLRIPVAVNLSM